MLTRLKSLLQVNKVAVLAALLTFSFASVANENAINDEQLKKIQAQIKQKKAALNKQKQQQKSVEIEFEETELIVAEVVLTLTSTNNKLALVNNKIDKLNVEKEQLQQQQKQHQTVLAELVKTAYMNGNHDYAKLLLNQDSPASIERLITYYKSLNDARVKQLEQIHQVLNRLQTIATELNEQQRQLAELKTQQEQDKRKLTKAQNNRKRALARIKSSIRSDISKLKQLEQDEKRITQAIANAQRQRVVSPENLAGLYNLKKKLKWPTSGKRRNSFGQRRTGSLRWKGVVIAGQLGASVNSIASGIVLYADWLKGFGWVTVVDHGKGYMSLYGHNQALLKQVGDYVEQDEPLALVGQSGGQDNSGLYFEIRYKGKTVNPARWCR